MPVERFYLDTQFQERVTLEGSEFHHLAHVMRVRIGEKIELVNGRGALAQAQVHALTKHSAILEILSMEQTPIHPSGVSLAIPLMRPAKLELIIEKCTELGADAFYLYPAHHSEKEDLSPNQLERLHHIAISAMKQCGRLDLPLIQLLNRFDDLFTLPLAYLFGDTQPNAKPMPSRKNVLFISGPEKGFSDKESKLLQQKGEGVSLHKNILRAETAPLAALCQLNILI